MPKDKQENIIFEINRFGEHKRRVRRGESLSIFRLFLLKDKEQKSADLSIEIEEGAVVKVQTAGLLFGESVFMISEKACHLAESSSSELVLGAVLGDRAVIDYDSNQNLLPNSKKSSGSEKANILYLSKDASFKAVPRLEMSGHLGRTAHGFSAGRINPEQIFYLSSFGFSRETCLKVIALGQLEKIFSLAPPQIQEEARAELWEFFEKNFKIQI